MTYLHVDSVINRRNGAYVTGPFLFSCPICGMPTAHMHHFVDYHSQRQMQFLVDGLYCKESRSCIEPATLGLVIAELTPMSMRDDIVKAGL